MISEPWLWLIGGILLILSEFVVPGFIICFFGVGAVVVAVLGSMFDIPVAWELLIFSVVSVTLLFTCRRFMPSAFRGNTSRQREDPDSDEVKGCRAVVKEAITPELPGKVDFRGSLWSAGAAETIAVGEIVEITDRENIHLRVRRLAQAE